MSMCFNDHYGLTLSDKQNINFDPILFPTLLKIIFPDQRFLNSQALGISTEFVLQKFCICISCICISYICRLCRTRQGKRERVWAGQATSYLASPLPHRHRLTYLYFPVSVFVLQHLGYFSIAMPCNRHFQCLVLEP